MSEPLLNEVADYYTAMLAKHGETPRGVDWNGTESQTLRFEQLCKVIQESHDFSVSDLGCGYGAMVEYFNANYDRVVYDGYDVAASMVAAGKAKYSTLANVQFHQADKPLRPADYGVASGIFNVRQQRDDAQWLDYIKETLGVLDRASTKGFAFNCLTSYSDADKKREYLYYADPCVLFDHCKKHFSKNVALLHDYGLYEFTILVRKA